MVRATDLTAPGAMPGIVSRVPPTDIAARGNDRIVKLVIGLGNPGGKYAGTRHNVGWMVLDRLADRAGRSGRGRQRDAAESIQIRYEGQELVLAKPLTYMNESGIAVRKLLARERTPLGEMLVVVDDFALPFGKLRFREGGSHGGHNGLRSIIDELGTEKVSRLRVGIGEPGRGAIDHVLSTFSADEEARLPIVLDAAADAVMAWAREGTSKAANRFNAFELQAPSDTVDGPAPGEVGGPPDEAGVRRTRTGWRRILGLGGEPDERADDRRR
jgi:PTH1 family peptidyl-tRNA hydrolase